MYILYYTVYIIYNNYNYKYKYKNIFLQNKNLFCNGLYKITKL